jgi:serine/threonine protein kinase
VERRSRGNELLTFAQPNPHSWGHQARKQRLVMYYHLMLLKRNILVDKSQRAVLCDFGFVRIFLDEGHSGMTTTSEYTGTTRYLAPELVIPDYSVCPTTSSDVYAAGCIGLEVPFTAPGRF